MRDVVCFWRWDQKRGRWMWESSVFVTTDHIMECVKDHETRAMTRWSLQDGVTLDDLYAPIQIGVAFDHRRLAIWLSASNDWSQILNRGEELITQTVAEALRLNDGSKEKSDP